MLNFFLIPAKKLPISRVKGQVFVCVWNDRRL